MTSPLWASGRVLAACPTPPGASGPRCARWRGCQARPSRGVLSQPPNYAVEPGRPARLPGSLSPAAPTPGASPRPRWPGGSGRGAAPKHLGRARAAGAALPELRAGPRSPPPGAAVAACRPEWQRRPRGRLLEADAVRAAGGDREGGGPAPGADGWGPIEPAGRDAGASSRLPGPLPARRASPEGRSELVGGAATGAGGPSRAEPGLSGTFPGKFPERQVFGSGFCPLDFAPACGRLKGNQKWVSDTKTPLTNGSWLGRVTIRLDN